MLTEKMRLAAKGEICCNSGGTYVLWYTDDDGGSGYGDNAHRSFWYGSHSECQRRIDEREIPARGDWVEWDGETSGPIDPMAALLELRYD
jgi:hypothetical protein